ncbi:MAG: winged helix-turn-helix domain-containing protein, partial [Pseudomonadales bacterium]
RRVRETSVVPILMLTALNDEFDRVTGLELGADDYLPKPCNPRELVARIKAVLRRTTSAAASEPGTRTLRVNQLLLEPSKHQISYADTALALTNAEFSILSMLMQKAGRVVSKETLYSEALGREFTAYDRSIDMHLSNIRKKLAAYTSTETIKNVRGIGYMLLQN